MTTKIGGIVVDVDARLTKLEASLKKGNQEFNRFANQSKASGRRVEQSVGGMNKAFASLKNGIGALGIGLGINALVDLGRSALQMADDLDTAANRAGIGVVRFQTLREVFRAAEVDAGAFDKSLVRLNGTLGDVQRGVKDEATKAIAEMGIATRITSGEITTADGLLDAIAGSAKTFGTEAEFTSAMVDIFGQRLGGQLAPALRVGTEAIHEAEQALIDAGFALDELSVNKLANANEVIDRFAAQTQVTFANWAASVITDIQNVGLELEGLSLIYQRDGLFAAGSIMAFAPERARDAARGSRGINKLSGMSLSSVLSGDHINGKSSPPVAPSRASVGGRKRSGGGRKSGGGSKGISEEQRLTEEYAKQTLELERQSELMDMRAWGNEFAADVLEANWTLEEKFTKLGKEKLDAIKAQNLALLHQEAQLKAIVQVTAKTDVDSLLMGEDQVTKELQAMQEGTIFAADKIGAANVRIAKSFQDSANDSIAAIQQLSSAVQGGSFLDILSAVVGLGLQLGSIGAFGSNVAKNINKVPGHANGIGYSPGGLAVVGERGPELVNLPRGSEVVPNGRSGANDNRPYFDLRGAVMTADLINQMNQIGARSAMAGAALGSSGAQSAIARHSTRRLA